MWPQDEPSRPTLYQGGRGRSGKPNIVWMLPSVKASGEVWLSRFFCPSRASVLCGKRPHQGNACARGDGHGLLVVVASRCRRIRSCCESIKPCNGSPACATCQRQLASLCFHAWELFAEKSMSSGSTKTRCPPVAHHLARQKPVAQQPAKTIF